VQLHRKLRTIYHWWGSWYVVADALGTTQKNVGNWLRYDSHPNLFFLNRIDAEYLISMERLRRYNRKRPDLWKIEDTVANLEWEENVAMLEQQAEVWLLKNSLTGIVPPDTLQPDEEKPREGPRATVVNQPPSGENREARLLQRPPEAGENPESSELK
jgi:hypothetical protein